MIIVKNVQMQSMTMFITGQPTVDSDGARFLFQYVRTRIISNQINENLIQCGYDAPV